tara:strand:- start:145 stop:444 length:300 start_codon:yes stop_codon:yes gene_type:complete
LNLKAKKIILNNKVFQIFILTTSFLSFTSFRVNSEENYFSKDLEIDHSNSLEKKDLPTNPFEIVEMIRRANSMNDATKPSDAIDDAIKSFDMIKNRKSI